VNKADQKGIFSRNILYIRSCVSGCEDVRDCSTDKRCHSTWSSRSTTEPTIRVSTIERLLISGVSSTTSVVWSVTSYLLISVLIITMELGSILFLAEHNVAVLATAKPLDTYCRAMLCKRRRAVCVRACVCLSVCHVRTFCQNELTYLRNFFTVG